MNKNDQIMIRFLMLFIPSIIISWLFFQNVGGFLYLDLEANKTGKEQILDVSNDIQKQFKDKIKDLEKLLNIPNAILRYKIYAQNNVYTTSENKKLKDSLMIIDVNGQYEKVKTKSIKFFERILKTPEEILEVPIAVSFDLNNSDQKVLEITSDKYRIGIKPTILSWIIVFFFSCLSTHLFWFILYKWYKFVRYSSF